ncbi:hypothetical protein B0H63DRAFT_470873 [Podospora didyma]|uniref:Uncharacterized protein n=1 Tax=Podospora didyma TaxID=330526 RepID=A0AAE0NU44_9PEZI|nr:hypothetical protein B0H63DRAFT_470873 [Podospora didyma]
MLGSKTFSLALGVVSLFLTAASACLYGPDQCIAGHGWVWRDAFVGDHVCVPVAIRTEAARDNSLAASRRQPGGGAYGPDTCKQGFVWREARPSDHVCVPVATRTRTRAENAEAPYRIICSCSLPFYKYEQKWFGTAPFCRGSCPSEWHQIRRASSGGQCDRSKKGVCISCSGFGSSCWTGSKVLCESDVAAIVQS